MKKIYLTMLLLAMGMQFIAAQTTDKAFGIKFKGFIKHEMIYDSRQTVTSRDGTVLLFPAAITNDINGNDINADPQFNLVTLTSRLQGIISGPDAFGAKTSGLLSFDFVGTGNDKVVMPRVRQAFVKLKWENSTLLLGKAWHPLFATEVFPQVLTFGAAIPCYTLNRAPQIRYTYNIKGLSIAAAISTQDDFKTIGPNGRSCSYLVNSGTPEFNARIMYKADHFIVGVAGGFWTVKPSLTNNAGLKTDATVSGMLLNIFAKANFSNVTLRGGYLMGENVSQLMMFGGFGVSEIAENGDITYTTTQGNSAWADVAISANKWSFGLFGGYTQNLGSNDPITGAVYAIGSNISDYLRVSPRITYTNGKVKVGLEGVYHVAAYGTPNENYVVENTTDAEAFRLQTSVAYIF